MSYSAEISFKTISSIDELFLFLDTYKKCIIDNLEVIAENEFYYCPLFRINNLEISFDELYNFKEYIKAEAWFERVFKYRWFYNKDWSLLGVYGVPKCTHALFDGTVYFQNSCDQDYEKFDYDGIDVFENIWDKWNSEIDDVIVNKLKYSGYEDEDILHTSESLDYYRRTFAYKEIWSYIEYTLYNEDNITYLSIFEYYDINYKLNFLRNCFEKAKKELL